MQPGVVCPPRAGRKILVKAYDNMNGFKFKDSDRESQ